MKIINCGNGIAIYENNKNNKVNKLIELLN